VHVVPVNPGGHWHWKVSPGSATHVAPDSHGSEEHGSKHYNT
jgi:hypothetical protein